MKQEEIIELLDKIVEKMINEDSLGFSPAILQVLDNVEASNQEIEKIKIQIGIDILAHLFNMANSVYFGSLKKGSIQTFYEVVTRLGMSHTKAFIIILALRILARDDQEIESIFARCFASAVLGKILAGQFGMREDTAKKVELGGLFSEIGKMIILLYKKKYAPEDPVLNDRFISTYHGYLTERIIDKFALPDYLSAMILFEGIVVEANYLVMSSMTRMAVSIVNDHFNQHAQHLLIDTMPLPQGHDKKISLDVMMEEQFNAVGLGKYLRIIKKRERLLPKYEDTGQTQS
jgi:hypothetical protein